MRSIKAKLKKPSSTSNINKDDWSKLDQRIWHSVAVNQPAKLAAKLSKSSEINVNKLCPSVGYSVVHYAASKGLDDCLNVLLAHKANVSTRDVTGATPLHASARYGHKGTTTKLLASRSVDVNAYDQNQCTALHFASFEGHLECLRLIANEQNCNIHCVDKEGRTALMVAAAMGRLPVCQELIKRGVDVNHKDSGSLQHTALTLAAESGHAEVVKLLCENGADYHMKLSDGKNALDVARNRARRSVVDALHVIQLTQAAKKTDRGARLSVGGSLQSDDFEKPEQPIPSQRISVVSPYKEEGSASNIRHSGVKQDEAKSKQGSPATQRSNPAVMSLYTESKQNSLYDRDISLYDSKSTLASISSLDVSIAHDTNKNLHLESSPLAKPRSSEAAKHALKLTEDLVLKEERIAALESQIAQLKTDNSLELDAMKISLTKCELCIQKLEKANTALVQDRQRLQEANKLNLEEIAKLQTTESSRLSSAEKICGELQEKLSQTEDRLGIATTKIEELANKNIEAMNRYSSEQRKNEMVKTGLNQLLVDIGKPSEDGDCEECLRLLKSKLLQAKEKNAKKLEDDKKRKEELEQLEDKVLEQDDLIEVLKEKLGQSDIHLQNCKVENERLATISDEGKEKLVETELLNSKQKEENSHLKREISHLKNKLSKKSNNHLEVKDLKSKLEIALSMKEQIAHEYNEDKSLWKHAEDLLEREAQEAKERYNDALQKAVQNEKLLSELRVERNQREAKITQLQRELQKSENKSKEIEVDTNRARQQLTEANYKCSKLQEEIASLREVKKELTAKLNSTKMYACNDVERNKIDAMNAQLEQLCQHIHESEKKYNETISIYRGHLLMAAKGELNSDVLNPLREILKLREEPESSNNL